MVRLAVRLAVRLVVRLAVQLAVRLLMRLALQLTVQLAVRLLMQQPMATVLRTTEERLANQIVGHLPTSSYQAARAAAPRPDAVKIALSERLGT